MATNDQVHSETNAGEIILPNVRIKLEPESQDEDSSALNGMNLELLSMESLESIKKEINAALSEDIQPLKEDGFLKFTDAQNIRYKSALATGQTKEEAKKLAQGDNKKLAEPIKNMAGEQVHDVTIKREVDLTNGSQKLEKEMSKESNKPQIQAALTGNIQPRKEDGFVKFTDAHKSVLAMGQTKEEPKKLAQGDNKKLPEPIKNMAGQQVHGVLIKREVDLTNGSQKLVKETSKESNKPEIQAPLSENIQLPKKDGFVSFTDAQNIRYKSVLASGQTKEEPKKLAQGDNKKLSVPIKNMAREHVHAVAIKRKADLTNGSQKLVKETSKKLNKSQIQAALTENVQPRKDSGFVKFTNAQHKRYKSALTIGLTKEEARVFALEDNGKFPVPRQYMADGQVQDVIVKREQDLFTGKQKLVIETPVQTFTAEVDIPDHKWEPLREVLTRNLRAIEFGTSDESDESDEEAPALKRNRAVQQPLAPQQAKRFKTAAQEAATPSNRRIVRSLRLALVPTRKNSTPLTPEQLAHLQETVVDVAIQRESVDTKPNFENCISREGWLILVCSNTATADWLRRNFGLIKTTSGLDIELREEHEFPKTHVISGYFPQSLKVTDGKVLATIAAQNELSTSDWEITKRMTKSELLHLTIVVDDFSYAKLVELKGRIAYRFGQIELMLEATSAGGENESASAGNVSGGHTNDGPSTSSSALQAAYPASPASMEKFVNLRQQFYSFEPKKLSMIQKWNRRDAFGYLSESD